AKKAQGKASMAHHLLASARRLFVWVIDQGDYGLEHSPCDHIKAKSLIGKVAVRQRTLNDDELRALVRACEREGYPHGDCVRLLLLTGTRHREASEAVWSEFDLVAKKVWTIGQERYKSGAPHIVPLTPGAISLLEGVPRFRANKYVFSASFGRKSSDVGSAAK